MVRTAVLVLLLASCSVVLDPDELAFSGDADSVDVSDPDEGSDGGTSGSLIQLPGSTGSCSATYVVQNKKCGATDILGKDCAVPCGGQWSVDVSTQSVSPVWQFSITGPFTVTPETSTAATQALTVEFSGICGSERCGDPDSVPDAIILVQLTADGQMVSDTLKLDLNANDACPELICP
jgi:hypothetical protein